MSNFRIALDGNEANRCQRVGSNVYAFELLCALERITRSLSDKIAFEVLLSSAPVSDWPAERPGWSYRVVGPARLWTQWGLPLYLFCHQGAYDVFFTPGHYAPRWCSVPYICSVMDLGFLKFPETFARRDLYQLSAWTRYSVKRAAAVVAISKFTKKEVARAYQRAERDIVVAYPAFSGQVISLTASERQQLLSRIGRGKKYFVYLGTLQPRKNIARMVEAFDTFVAMVERGEEWQLVLAGKDGWLMDEIEEAIGACRSRRQIVRTGFVDERQKGALLAGATASLNLGLYEGFGIPALESLAYRTLPICANNTSLPEVVGQMGLGVNPFRPNSIAKAMIAAVTWQASREKARFGRQALAQLGKFSYDESALMILETILKVATRKA